MLFRGFFAADWFGEKSNNFNQFNRIIIKECVMFYNECWRSRNTIYHSKEVQMRVLAEWSLNTREFAM